MAEEYKKINLHFKKFGFYPNNAKPFVTLDIAENNNVIDLQRRIYTTFMNKETEESNGFFTPGIWKPDI